MIRGDAAGCEREFLRSRLLSELRYGLALRLAAREFLDLLLVRSAGRRPLGLGSGLLAGGPLDFLPFQFVFNFGGVGHRNLFRCSSMRARIFRLVCPFMLPSIEVARKPRLPIDLRITRETADWIARKSQWRQICRRQNLSRLGSLPCKTIGPSDGVRNG